MIGDALQSGSASSSFSLSSFDYLLQRSQEVIYRFLLSIVRNWPPEEVLWEFKRLFILNLDSISTQATKALNDLIIANNEEQFRHTLKRSCYILVNNWDATRHFQPIQDLVQSFADPSLQQPTTSPFSKRLHQWVNNFVQSEDYAELKLFASRYNDGRDGPWVSRYTSYLLVPQYIDLRNPIEQREAARALSRQLKDRFKFDLAMYIARSQSRLPTERVPQNPTVLGEQVLRLIKIIVTKRGSFGYANLANIFLKQVEKGTYKDFKQSLQRYLIFSVANPEIVQTLRSRLAEKLDALYSIHDHEILSNALIFRTCNRVLEFLTTETQEAPSPLFILLLSQGNPLTLVITLLKLILICHHCRPHLEARIADLIRYYRRYPEAECAWMVHFLEVFNVTFTIHTENVEYNLVKMGLGSVGAAPQFDNVFDPDQYRIFSQVRNKAIFDWLSEVVEEEELKRKDGTADRAKSSDNKTSGVTGWEPDRLTNHQPQVIVTHQDVSPDQQTLAMEPPQSEG
ncbi:MAG: hypothetical protein ACKO24_13600 [Leptolyngbyaceae cyanobacterium]